ncbi:MAG: GxxExxY protein [Limisphaerales bacterium]
MDGTAVPPENVIAKGVVDAAFQMHSTLGPGLLESVYEVILARELQQRGFEVERQRVIPLVYNNIHFEEAFRADLVINNKVIVEIKSIDEIAAVHSKQVLTYLRLTNLKLGLLINFGAVYIKDGIERIINGKLE